MTLSFNQLTQFFILFLNGNRRKASRIQKLDLNSLNEDMLRDLNLPPDMNGKFEAHRALEKLRRRHLI